MPFFMFFLLFFLSVRVEVGVGNFCLWKDAKRGSFDGLGPVYGPYDNGGGEVT